MSYTVRQQRLAAQIRTILSELFLRELNDPRLQGVTLTDVKVDREVQYADIYVNALGEDSRRDEVMTALERASSFLRRELGKSLRTRHIPQLHFHWDPTPARAEQLNKLLDNLDIPPADEEKPANKEEAAE